MEKSEPSSAADTRTEKEKMLAGDLYFAFGPQSELTAERVAARHVLRRFNDSADEETRLGALRELLGGMSEEDPPFIEPPFRCDYGAGCVRERGGRSARVELGAGWSSGPGWGDCVISQRSSDPHTTPYRYTNKCRQAITSRSGRTFTQTSTLVSGAEGAVCWAPPVGCWK